jgi:hypothetical protein
MNRDLKLDYYQISEKDEILVMDTVYEEKKVLKELKEINRTKSTPTKRASSKSFQLAVKII